MYYGLQVWPASLTGYRITSYNVCYTKLLRYNVDPEKDAKAIKFNFISFDDVLRKGLKVMDTTAFTLSQENQLPIIVFDMNKKGNLLKVVSGEKVGTEVNI